MNPLPRALQNDEISDRDVEALLRAAQKGTAKFKMQPKRIKMAQEIKFDELVKKFMDGVSTVVEDIKNELNKAFNKDNCMVATKLMPELAKAKSQGGYKDQAWLEFGLNTSHELYVRGSISGWHYANFVEFKLSGLGLPLSAMKEIVDWAYEPKKCGGKTH